jgi:hypothetical protein
MTEFFRRIFDSGLMPQGGITLGRPAATWLEVVSDALIAIAYFSILVTLTCFVRNRRDLPYRWMFVTFGFLFSPAA